MIGRVDISFRSSTWVEFAGRAGLRSGIYDALGFAVGVDCELFSIIIYKVLISSH
jgi:hypothetical protein